VVHHEQAVFLKHHQDDAYPDRFYPMEKKMTVFGFGRKGMEKCLDRVPQSFSIGFLETTNHAEIERLLGELAIGG